MVVIRMPDGSIQDFHLRCVSQSLRLVRPCASYELAMMVADGRWEIVGVRTEAANRLLRRAGLLPAVFARRQRWRTSLLASKTRVPTNATGWEFCYLVSLGADVNDKADGGSTVLDTCLRYFGSKETIWEPSYLTSRHSTVPASRLGQSLDALGLLLERGARWTPDDRAVGDTRRALYRVGRRDSCRGRASSHSSSLRREDSEGPRPNRKVRSILAEVNRRRASAERQVKRVTARGLCPESPTTAKPTPARLPPSRYDRQRLYEEVWSEPTQQVAKRYGVSDVAIAKACALLDIPKVIHGKRAGASRKNPSHLVLRPPNEKVRNASRSQALYASLWQSVRL